MAYQTDREKGISTIKPREPLSRTEQKMFSIILPQKEGILLSEIWKRFEALTGKKYSRTTIVTFLQRIEAKGYIRREKCGRVSTVFPLITQDEYLLGELTYFCEGVFGGDMGQMMSFMSENIERIIKLK